MPLHLESLTNDKSPAILAWILQEELQKINDAFSKGDSKYFLGSINLWNQRTGHSIGKYVFTFFSNTEEQKNEILDIDIVLYNGHLTRLFFDKKLPQSSDSNEYYEVTIGDTEQQLIVETVNRYTVEEEIEGTTRAVCLSAFPFHMTVFNSQKDYNRFFGFDKPIEVADTGIVVQGLGTNITLPGTIFGGVESLDKTPSSFVVGTIVDYEKVTISFGKKKYDAYNVLLDTAMGDLPTLVGKKVFNTWKLKKGRIVAMSAYIKADFVRDNYPVKE